jgi:two-component system sensor histidine kinase KdpD
MANSAMASAGLEPLGTARAQAPSFSAATGYGLSLVLVAAAVVVAFVVDHLIPTPNLSLIFVLPVMIAALSFGWGPALASAVFGVAAFDFFFVAPRGSLQVYSPTDLWAMGLLLVVAAIASTVAAQSRGRAVAARRAADQAQALHALAHAVIEPERNRTLTQSAADALGRIFGAPAVVMEEEASGALTPAALARVATISDADREAAQWALANGRPTRAETYPFDQAQFDFWPVTTPTRHLVLGVQLADVEGGRPANPERYVELVAGYLAAATPSA